MLHDISTNLETEVLFNRNKKGNGKIIIPFENDKDLEGILKKFKLKN